MKKLLALVLALVMTLSLCVTSNAAYDGEDFDYAEAVEVMSAIGVFQGDENGKFNPKDILTREQAAKVVTYMLLGKKAADALVTIAAPFADVEATRWSAGSIAYCYNEGILAGVGEGKFAPTAQLTGLQFAKMMLTALGYDAEVEGLTGANWSINAAKLALQLKLTKGMDDVSLSAPMTREQACKMALNTEKATLVKYDNQSTITAGNVTVTTQSAAEKVLGGNGKIAPDGYAQFAEEYATDLRLYNTFDGMARPAHEWRLKNVSIGTYADDADYTAFVTTKNDTLVKVVDAISKKFNDNTAVVYVNGVADDTNAAEVGNIVELYMNENDSNKVDLIIVTYKTVAKLTNDAATKVSGTDTLVKVPGVINAYSTAHTTENVHGYAGLVEDDIVLYYADNNGDVYIEKAESFTGTMTVSSLSGGIYTLKIGGTEYKTSEVDNTLDSGTIDPEDFYKEDATWYLDNGGNIVWVEGIESTVLAYVVALGSNNFNTWGSTTYYAKLLMTEDGTVKEVKTDVDYSTGTNLTNHFVKYSVNKDGEYVLTDTAAYVANTTTGQQAGTAANLDIIKGKPGMTLDTAVTANANSETIFFIRDYNTATAASKDSYSKVTGYASVPSMDVSNVNGNVAAYVKSNTYAQYVVIDPIASVSGLYANTDMFYVTSATVKSHWDPDDGRQYWTVKAIVAGSDEVVDLEFNFDPSTTVAKNANVAIAASTGYTVVNRDKDNRIDSYSAALTQTGKYLVNNGVAAENATTVRLNSVAWNASEATVYYVNKDGEMDVIAVEDIETDGSDTYVAVLKDTTGTDAYKLKYLFIREVDAALPVVTTHLANYTGAVNDVVTLTVVVTPATGNTTHYAWYVDGVLDTGAADAASYTVDTTVAGTYAIKCVITNVNNNELNEIASVNEFCTVVVS